MALLLKPLPLRLSPRALSKEYEEKLKKKFFFQKRVPFFGGSGIVV
jgi:hypothetical protein